MKFKPSFSERNDFDLILIAKNYYGDWHSEAMKLAREEPASRSLSDYEINQIYEKIIEDGKCKYEANLEKRKSADCDLWENL